jgi:hypothetical protein
MPVVVSGKGGASWREIGIGALAVVVAVGLMLGVFRLRVLYMEADAVEGFADLGDGTLLVGERIHDRGDETGPVGGDRLVVIDARSGEVRRRKSTNGETFLGVYGDPPTIWMRDRDRSLVTRAVAGPNALTVLEPSSGHEARTPELVAMHDRASIESCVLQASAEVRFTSKDGRHFSFDLASRALRSVAEPCPRRDVAARSATLDDGSLLEVRTPPGTSRAALVRQGRRGEGDARPPAPAPLPGIDGLELTLISDVRSAAWPRPPFFMLGDILATRRTTTDAEAPTELVRIDLRAPKIVWSTPIHAERGRIVRVLFLERPTPTLILEEDRRLFGIDPATGALLWRRGPR